MKSLLDWLDHRTGYRHLTREALYENIPGGARWRYVWGSTLVFAFVVQAITGSFLWMAYSASGQTAWESVYYIQHEMYGGWLLRGIHHFMAQAMVVLLAFHLMQVVIDGAYRAPREVNFWLGLILMKIVLGLSLTGYLLPWDQKGYWATRVATNLAGIVPFVGPYLQKIVVGGSDYGHFTLTRFFALHAGILPATLIGFLVLHIALFRRHGIHAKVPLPAKGQLVAAKPANATFWPDQVLKDAVACLAVLCVVLALVFMPVFQGATIPERPGDILGAHLDAPADRANEYSAARPEWYFLFLFQFLKYFEGMGEQGELLGAIVVPGALMGMLFLMPILGRWNLGHRFNVLFTIIILFGAAGLTAQAIYDDNMAKYGAPPPIAADGKPTHKQVMYKASQDFIAAVDEAKENAHRAIELARAPRGIPSTGLLSVMNTDPKVQGPRLFKRYCASCHDYADGAGKGMVNLDGKGEPASSAPNLYRFASREWIAGVLDPKRIATHHYFGKTKHVGGEMVGFVNGDLNADTNANDIKLAVIALSAEAKLPGQRQLDADDAAKITEGKVKLASLTCTDCHKFHDKGELGSAPDLTGYGSYEWIEGMISNPTHERFYRDQNDRMPSFAASKKSEENTLSPENLDLLVHWLRGEWFEPTVAKK